MTNIPGRKRQMLALGTFIKLIRGTNSVCTDVHRHFLAELTVGQFGILEALHHLGPMAQKELAAKILKSPGNITTIINNLEKSNLVTRAVNEEDKRYCTIDLTDKGKALIERVLPTHTAAVSDRMSVLTESELRTLGQLLHKLSQGKKRTTDPARI